MDTETRADLIRRSQREAMAIPVTLDDDERGYLVLPSRTLSAGEVDRLQRLIASLGTSP